MVALAQLCSVEIQASAEVVFQLSVRCLDVNGFHLTADVFVDCAQYRCELMSSGVRLGIYVDGDPKAPKSGEHKIWGLTFWIAVFS